MRQIGRKDISAILPYVEPFMHVEKDFYNIVAARVYAELLGYATYRVQDEYVIVGQIDGQLAAIVNGRIVNPDVGTSYHTMSLRGGLRVGAHAFATKMEYHLEYLKQKEVLIVAESPIGFKRWMGEYNLEKRFQIPHELGGAPSWSLTKELYDKVRGKLVQGRRPVPDQLLKKAEAGILPPRNLPIPPKELSLATRAMIESAGMALSTIADEIKAD